MSAIILCRISDLKQDDGYSLDAQERYGKEYCERNGFSINEIFRFVETGSKFHKREKFNKMMEFIRNFSDKNKKKTLHLVVEKPDRLTRNFTNREQLQFFVMTGRLVIHYYKDKRVLDKNSSPADIFTDDMMTSVSKYIALNIARETKKGMRERARNGWFPGHVPLGYKNVRKGSLNKHGRKEARIEVDQETRPAALRVFELRSKGFSYYSIRDQILRESLLPEKRAKRFSKSSVEKILLNPFYSGKFFWDGEWYEGKHEVFVPKALLESVNQKRGAPNKPGPVGVFSHWMSCNVEGCGCAVIFDPKTKINRSTGKKKTYNYYHCSDGKRVHKSKSIKQVNLSENFLWEIFSEPIHNISLNEDLADHIMTAIKASEDISKTKADEMKKEATANLHGLKLKEERLYGDLLKGLMSEEVYLNYLEKLKSEREQLKAPLKSHQTQDSSQVELNAEYLLELCKRSESVWKKGSDEERLSLIKKVCSNPQVKGSSVRYDLKKPFEKIVQIKNKKGDARWCPARDLNPHASRH